MTKTILIVDDDSLMRRSLSISLEQAGYRIETAGSAEEAAPIVRDDPPDLLLLDIGLPGTDGLEVLRSFRQQHENLPVIFVTARRRELDEIVGLELGADDYITKPFDMDVLLAHIKAVLRRTIPAASPRLVPGSGDAGAGSDSTVTAGDIHIDVDAHQVEIGGSPVQLSPKEFDLLLYFAQNPGKVLSLDELLEAVWGSDWVGESQTLYVHIRWLRQKIEEDPANPSRILTVRGVGYRLVPAETEQTEKINTNTGNVETDNIETDNVETQSLD